MPNISVVGTFMPNLQKHFSPGFTTAAASKKNCAVLSITNEQHDYTGAPWEFLEKDLVRLKYDGASLYFLPEATPLHAPTMIRRMRAYESDMAAYEDATTLTPTLTLMARAGGLAVTNTSAAASTAPTRRQEWAACYMPRTIFRHMRHIPPRWFAELWASDTMSMHAAEGIMRTLIIFRKRAAEWIGHTARFSCFSDWVQLQPVDYADMSVWLPIMGRSKSTGLADYLLRFHNSKVEYLKAVAHAWPKIPPDLRSLAPKRIYEQKADLLLSKYKATRNDLCFQAFKAGIGVRRYATIEKRWLSSLSTPVLSDVDVSFGTMRGRFLRRDDPRGLFLGSITNCCQSPGSAAASSAWYGQESASSGFFVVEDGKGRVVVQSWAWVIRGVILFFDSVEGASDVKEDQAGDVVGVYKLAAQKLKEQMGLLHVVVGPSERVSFAKRGLRRFLNATISKKDAPRDVYTDIFRTDEKSYILCSDSLSRKHCP
jgi:hypothetical protein